MDEKSDRAPRKDVIYHYTSQAGLLGILESKSIWATHVRYLNDSSEFERGRGIAKRQIENLRIDPDRWKAFAADPQGVEFIQNSLRDSINQTLKTLDDVEVFVASFFDSVEFTTGAEVPNAGDILEQWRAYSADKPGFSIGFDKKALASYIAEIGEDSESPICSGNCNYQESIQELILQDRVSRIAPTLLGSFEPAFDDFRARTIPKLIERVRSMATSQAPDEAIKQAAAEAISDLKAQLSKTKSGFTESLTSIFVGLLIPLIFMKHPSFKTENEWRIVKLATASNSDFKFRQGQSCLIPYVSIPLPIRREGFIRRIVVGASPKKEDSLKAVKLLLTSRGYRVRSLADECGIEVVNSEIPNRTW